MRLSQQRGVLSHVGLVDWVQASAYTTVGDAVRTHRLDTVESLVSDVGVLVKADEQPKVKHALHLGDGQQIPHVLHELRLQLVTTLLVAAHSISLLWQHWHVVVGSLKSKAAQFDDGVQLLEV